MPRKNCFVKVSGDMLNDKVMRFIKGLSEEYFVVVCVGGGTQINEAFKKEGLLIGDFGPLGRETKSFRERQLAQNILETNQAEIQDRLDAMGVRVNVVIPVLNIGTVPCHINGDQFTLAAYHGFDILCIVTVKDRVAEKEKFFAPYPKIHVVEL